MLRRTTILVFLFLVPLAAGAGVQHHPFQELYPPDQDLDFGGYNVQNASALETKYIDRNDSASGVVIRNGSNNIYLAQFNQSGNVKIPNGRLNMSFDNKIVNVSDPDNPQDAATKSYVDISDDTISDDQDLSEVLVYGNSANASVLMEGNNLTNPGYVDGVHLDNPGNAISVSGNQYQVDSNSINTSELASSSVTNSIIASSVTGSGLNGGDGSDLSVVWSDANDLGSDGTINDFSAGSELTSGGAISTFVNASDLDSSGSIVSGAVTNNEIDNTDTFNVARIQDSGDTSYFLDPAASGTSLKLNGDAEVQGDLDVWGNITNTNVQNLNVNGSLLPPQEYDNTFDVGSSSRRWSNAYVAGSLYDGSTDNFFENGNLGIGKRVTGIDSDGTIQATTIGHDNLNGLSSSSYHPQGACSGSEFLGADGNCYTDSNNNLTETDVEQYVFDSDNNEGGLNVPGNINLNNNNNIQSSGTNAITLDSNQNVGIPNGNLEINSDDSAPALNVSDSGTERLLVSDGGPVEVKNANLDINNNNVNNANRYHLNGGAIIDEGTADYGSIRVRNNCNSGWCGINIEGQSDYVLMTGGSNDNVGLYDDDNNNWLLKYDAGNNDIDAGKDLDVQSNNLDASSGKIILPVGTDAGL